jgi:hypothetical protein
VWKHEQRLRPSGNFNQKAISTSYNLEAETHNHEKLKPRKKWRRRNKVYMQRVYPERKR